eukprot:scaffold72266_cov53-Phaeocystis_antarctica.AAC.3
MVRVRAGVRVRIRVRVRVRVSVKLMVRVRVTSAQQHVRGRRHRTFIELTFRARPGHACRLLGAVFTRLSTLSSPSPSWCALPLSSQSLESEQLGETS